MRRFYRELKNVARPNDPLSFPFGEEDFLKESEWSARPLRVLEKYFFYPLSLRRLSAQSAGCHLLDHSYLFCAPWIKGRLTGTVHDIFPLSPWGSLSLSPQQIARFQRNLSYIDRLEKVICVSRFTAQEVMTILKVPAEKIFVNPPGVNEIFFNDSAEAAEDAFIRSIPTSRYILLVGTGDPRKNLASVPEILSRLPAKYRSDLSIVRAGPALSPKSVAGIGHALGPNRLFYREPSDSELRLLYQKAALLLFPSVYEGFGLPVAEALASRCPVVAARNSSLTEAGGAETLYFKTDDFAEAAANIIKIFEEPERVQHMREQGRLYVRQFQWRSHLDRLIEIVT